MALKRAVEELDEFKTRHPNYDISETEKFINNFKANHDQASSEADDSSEKINTLVETLEEVVKFELDSLGFIENEETAQKAGVRFNEFTERVDKTLTPDVIAVSNEINDRKIKQIKKTAERTATYRSASFQGIRQDKFKDVSDKYQSVRFYYEMATTREMLKILNRVFTDNEIIRTALAKVSEYGENMGSIESLQKLAGKNAAAKLAAVRMNKSNPTSQAVLGQFRSAFINRHGSQLKILRVILASNGWQIKRNKLTGIILERYRFGEIAARGTDGKCQTYLFAQIQDYNGSGYGRSYYGITTVREILCENVLK
jgi:hypothetical protein